MTKPAAHTPAGDAFVSEIATRVYALFGESVDDLEFGDLVDLALAEADRRALAEMEEGGPTFVVVDGWRMFSDGSWCEEG